jgi:hypothetical protein
VRLLLRQQQTEKEFDEMVDGVCGYGLFEQTVCGRPAVQDLVSQNPGQTRTRKLIQMFQAGQWRQAVSF